MSIRNPGFPHSPSCRSGAAALLALLAATASAQSSSSSFGSLDYRFELAAGSVGREADLTVTDDGEQTYNLVNADASDYLVSTGTGAGMTGTDANTAYDPLAWSGHNGIETSAGESAPTGTATASVGSQENLRLRNTGTTAISLLVSALAQIGGNATATGPSTASNFARVDTYVGIFDFNLTAGSRVANPLIHVSGTDASGVSTTATSDFAAPTSNFPYYVGTYSLTLAPGETHALQFYTSARNVTAAAPVPEPSVVLALLGGVAAVVRRRR